jgi:mono/diheme cytochrome c family protein
MNKSIQVMAAVASYALACCAANADSYDNFVLVEMAAVPDLPPVQMSNYPADRVEQGRYLVKLLGCGSCHTDGVLVGKPDAELVLAGSHVGIATSDPLTTSNPGVVYPPNITPDRRTGIGDWTLEQVVKLLQSGVDRHGNQTLPVMPWMNYSGLLPEDAKAIAMYLKSIPPVEHKVPANVKPGQAATAPYVHFGIYQSKANR